MSVIVLDQSVVHYESLGRGRPVLFLHTWIGSWRYWLPTMQAAAVSHSAYAMDFFGFAETAHDPARYSLDGQTTLIDAFLEDMGIECAALVGHGLGALLGLRFASQHPERTARVLAVCLPSEPSGLERALFSASARSVFDLLGEGHLESELLPAMDGIDARALNIMADARQIREWVQILDAARMPVLILNGGQDPTFQIDERSDALGYGPNVHQIVLPECGHFPMLDDPDAFHRLMLDFLALQAGDSPGRLRPREVWRRRVR